jgi:rhodanese-related sulfurtransferase
VSLSPQQVRHALVARQEIALLDLRSEHDFAQGHPLFAAQIPVDRILIEAPQRLPRKDVRIVVYDDGEGLTGPGVAAFKALGYSDVDVLAGGLHGWRDAGYELFRDVNSYSKTFGELPCARDQRDPLRRAIIILRPRARPTSSHHSTMRQTRSSHAVSTGLQ